MVVENDMVCSLGPDCRRPWLVVLVVWVALLVLCLGEATFSDISQKPAAPSTCVNLRGSVTNRQFYFLADESDERSNVTVGRVVLQAGRTVSARILNSMASHLLRGLGYRLLTLNDTRKLDTDSAVARLAGCNHYTDCHRSWHSDKRGDQSRDANIDLNTWLPLSYDLNPWLRTGQVMELGPIVEHDRARYGLYTTSHQVQSLWSRHNITLDHWRSLKLLSVASNFWPDYVDEPFYGRFQELLKPFIGAKNGNRFCDNSLLGGCCEVDGLCRSIPCQRNTDCGVVLATTPAEDQGLLLRQINALQLKLDILYVGPSLYRIVQELRQAKLPVLYYDSEPSPLIDDQTNRVSLPDCTPNSEIGRAKCDYEPNRVRKVVWSKLKRGAPEAFHLIENMKLKRQDFQDILTIYRENCVDRSCDLDTLTCDWLKRNRGVWEKWTMKGKTDIYIGGLVPMQNGSSVDMTGIDVAAGMALESINRNNSILADYNIILPIQNSNCSAYRATYLFMDYISNKTKNLVGILGPGCSSSAMVVAGVGKHYNRIVISYSAEEPQLGGFPNFFRTVPGRDQDMEVFNSLFRNVDGGPWRRIGMLTSVQYLKAFPEYFRKKGVEYVLDLELPESTEVHFDPKYYLQQFKDKHINIIVGEFYEQTARIIMCQAYKMNMTSRYNYQWFLPRWLDYGWWNLSLSKKTPEADSFIFQMPENEKKRGQEPTRQVDCTEQEMADAVAGYATLARPGYADDDQMAVGGLTIRQWKREFLSRLKVKHGRSHLIEFLGHSYDAMWVYALALDKLLKSYPGVERFITSTNVYEKLKRHIYECDFDGVTGHITIQKRMGLSGHDQGGNREGIVEIMQWKPVNNNPRNFSFVSLGRYVPTHNAGSHFEQRVELRSLNGMAISDGSEHFRKVCSVEGFRRVLGISSCNTALGVAYALGFGLVIVLFAVVGIILKIRYDRKVARTRERMRELGLFEHDALEHLNLDQWEVAREKVCLNRKLGEGAFGTVCGGEVYIDRDCMSGWVACAVKTLKEGASPMNRLDFLTEACLMKRFDHPNIVKLLGVTTTSTPAFCIMEFMLYGDLKNYLLARRQLVKVNPSHEDVCAETLTQMAMDIIQGVQYLASLKFVHRDLASRNCLVGESRITKIGDFGMTRHISESDYYRYNKKGMLPVRWMAPESLTDGIFTPLTDIWSYGVLIYEILTFGSFPYQGLSNNQVLQYVRDGRTIELPTGCSPQLKELVTACWSYCPDDRPEPETIINFISGIPNLITPFLDAPSAAVAMEGSGSLESIQTLIPQRRVTAISRSLTGSNSASAAAILQHLTATQPEAVKLLTERSGEPDGVSVGSAVSVSSDASSDLYIPHRNSSKSLPNGTLHSTEATKPDYVQIATTPEKEGSDGSKLFNSDKICPLNNHVSLKFIQPSQDLKNATTDSDYGSDYSKEVTSQV